MHSGWKKYAQSLKHHLNLPKYQQHGQISSVICDVLTLREALQKTEAFSSFTYTEQLKLQHWEDAMKSFYKKTKANKKSPMKK